MGAHRVLLIWAFTCLFVFSSISYPAEKIRVLIACSAVDKNNDTYDIAGGFARFVALARGNGFAVEGEFIDPFTEKGLTGVDILVLPIQARPLGSDEIKVLDRFVKSGGGILALGYYKDWYLGSDLASLNALATIYGISFAESSWDEKAALVTKDAPLSGPKPAAKLCSPFARVGLGVVNNRASAAAVFESGGILAAVSNDSKALGLGRIVVCGDASMATTAGLPPAIDRVDNAAFFMNSLIYLSGGPDLGIAKLKFVEDSVDPEDLLTVKLCVKNYGNRDSGGALLTVMLVSADGEESPAAMTPIKKSKVKPLSSGSTRKYKLKARIPAELESGEYLLFVKVEAGKGGIDVNAGNNSLASRNSLTVR